MKILTILLMLVSAALSLKHGRDAFHTANAEQAKMMVELGITAAMMPWFGAFSIVIGIMLFIPQTFVLSNVLNAMAIVLIIGLSLNAANYRTALIEIPFLALPLFLIWLKYPFRP